MYDWSVLQRVSLGIIIIVTLPIIPVKLLDTEEKYGYLLREAFDFFYFFSGTVLLIATICYVAACYGLYVEREELKKRRRNLIQGVKHNES